MKVDFTDVEVGMLRDLLEADLSRLLMEIARTDMRKMREGLADREDLLEAILKKLSEDVRRAA